MSQPLIFAFFLGIANFALHQAVLSSGHHLLDEMPKLPDIFGLRFTIVFEFAILLAAMLFIANGWPGFIWAYGLYFVLNAVTAWLILSNRI